MSSTSNYLHNIYIVLSIISKLEIIESIWENVQRLYANNHNILHKTLEYLWILVSMGVLKTTPFSAVDTQGQFYWETTQRQGQGGISEQTEIFLQVKRSDCIIHPLCCSLQHFIDSSTHHKGFLGSSMVKNSPANAGDMGSIPGSGRFLSWNEKAAPTWAEA